MKKIRKGYSNTITAICEDCKGEGILTIPGTYLGHGNYDDDTKETCETCNGEGMVKVRKEVFTTITITPHKTNQLQIQS